MIMAKSRIFFILVKNNKCIFCHNTRSSIRLILRQTVDWVENVGNYLDNYADPKKTYIFKKLRILLFRNWSTRIDCEHLIPIILTFKARFCIFKARCWSLKLDFEIKCPILEDISPSTLLISPQIHSRYLSNYALKIFLQILSRYFFKYIQDISPTTLKISLQLHSRYFSNYTQGISKHTQDMSLNTLKIYFSKYGQDNSPNTRNISLQIQSRYFSKYTHDISKAKDISPITLKISL